MNSRLRPVATGLFLAALFQTGKVSAKDPAGENALSFIESLVDAKEGHIANVIGGGKGAFHKNYVTSVNLIALHASGQEKYKAVIAKATAYLKKLQWDESHEKTPKDPYCGCSSRTRRC